MATDTPLSSTGSTGLRKASSPNPKPTADLSESASPTFDLTMLNSPAERPVASPGLGVGVGVGLGLALGSAAANGPMLLAPVKNESASDASVVTGGVKRRNTSLEPSELPPPISNPDMLNASRRSVLLVNGRIPETA